MGRERHISFHKYNISVTASVGDVINYETGIFCTKRLMREYFP